MATLPSSSSTIRPPGCDMFSGQFRKEISMIEFDRRTFLKQAGVGISFCIANDTLAKDPIYLADMHRHLWFIRLQSGEARPLGPVMAEGDATLVAWALGTDALWITRGPLGFIQKSVPAPEES